MVDVRAVAANPDVLAVGGLFDRYFSGINAKQYEQVLALFDPSDFLNPNDPAQVKSFTRGVSTSTDSQVVLRSITDDAAVDGDLDARLTLQSHQAAGFGPPGSPDETCTNWDITYQLRPAGGGYRILKPQAVAHTPC
jgi:eukaryotic-like serine/threonine-protein kinase